MATAWAWLWLDAGLARDPAVAGFLRFHTGARITDETLTNPSGFAGIDGLFRFLPDGRTERGYAIIEIGDRQRRVIDPAPESFTGPLTN